MNTELLSLRQQVKHYLYTPILQNIIVASAYLATFIFLNYRGRF